MRIAEPSIRGQVMELAALDLREALRSDDAANENARQRLGADAPAVLDEPIDKQGWYSMALYAEVLALLAELEGRGDASGYLRERGRRAAESLVRGRYEPLTDDELARGKSLGSLLVQLGPAIYSFGELKFQPIERRKRHALEFVGGAVLPDETRRTAEGFVESLAGRAMGAPVSVVTEERGDDLVFYVTARE